MKCKKCLHENPEDAKFCMECGSQLQKARKSSPIDFARPHSYTPKFLADKILTARSAMAGERKRVTVLFADVAGFTSMSERLDPEEVHQIMDGCFKILMDEIHDHHGTINQFTGDGVMALFGAPVAIENHARNACQAALAIQRAMQDYTEKLKNKCGIDFKIRIGLNSGPVIVGSIGDDLRMDYTAVGDTTNLAARMESMADPGSILVSQDTCKRISQFFILEPMGKVKVKGKEAPIEAYILVGQTEKSGAGLERRIFSEMVGRDNDLNKLKLQVSKAVSGEGSIVNIIGEAGIGKSRLIAELRNSSVMKRVTLLEGRAISIGRNLSFHPIINILKHWARINDKDTSVSALGKLEAAIRSVCPEDSNEIFPFVATLMGMKLSGRHLERVNGIKGEALEKLIFKNMRDLLIKTTELTPLVVVIEDLHWADTSSIELLESMFRLAETRRILFINIFRPNHPETGDRILETIKEKLPVYYVEIHLQPLNEPMGEMLINNMLNIKGLQPAVVDQIIQRAGGNPFFIEEVVRSFIDTGAVVKTNGEFKVTEKIEKMVIPNTINDVLMARIDRLDEDTRDLVKVASVIGRSFFFRILTEVANTVDGIDSRLSYLKQIELIREQQRLEELEYLFKHALVQEAAYESILSQRRKELHLKTADSIEKIFKERLHDFYGMLAFHYSRAEKIDKSEEYLIKAGEEALTTSASAEALHYFQEALSLYRRMYGENVNFEKIAMLEKKIAIALHNKGHYLESLKFLDRSLLYYGEVSPKNNLISILRFITSFIDTLTGIYLPFLKWKRTPTKKDIEIINLYQKKAEILSLLNPKKFVLESFYLAKRCVKLDVAKTDYGIGLIAGISLIFSWPGISFTISKKALDFAKDKVEKNDVRSTLLCEFCSLLHNCLTGNWNSVKAYDSELVNNALRLGEFFIVTNYLFWHGNLKVSQGRFHEAQQMVEKLSEIAEHYNNDFSNASKYQLKTELKMRHYKLNDALSNLKEGLDFLNKSGYRQIFFVLYSYKAKIHEIMGDYCEAEICIQYANNLKDEIIAVPFYLSAFYVSQFLIGLDRSGESITFKNNSELLIERKNMLKLGKKGVALSRKVSCDRAEICRLLGTYYWLFSKQKKALKFWKKSITEGKKLGAKPELSRTYFEVGKRLLEPNSKFKNLNRITAEQYLEKARKMFVEMDLQWDLDELEKITSARRPILPVSVFQINHITSH